jgi:anti-sigma factor RsiW
MNCEEAGVLLHALIDRELDAGHAREVEVHVAGCPQCAAQMRVYQMMRETLAAPGLRYEAPGSLRSRIDKIAPRPATVVPLTNRRSVLKGFAWGSAFSAAVAASVVVLVVRREDQQRTLGDVVSAHLRSLQADHLTDVLSTDQHTVKPWFNGKLDVAPPVIDLTAQGFTLLGGRLDYVNGRPVPAIVYRRRVHVINLFVAPAGSGERGAAVEKVQGYNVRRWTWSDLDFWAVSDINAEELQEFEEKFEAGVRASGGA